MVGDKKTDCGEDVGPTAARRDEEMPRQRSATAQVEWWSRSLLSDLPRKVKREKLEKYYRLTRRSSWDSPLFLLQALLLHHFS